MEARDIFARPGPVDAQHSMLDASTPSKRCRTNKYSLKPSAWSFRTPPTPPATRHHENISPAAGSQTGGQTAEMDKSVSGAQIDELMELVPSYMMDAIRKDKTESQAVEAAVTMFFPEKDLDMPCVITFDIVDQKVEFIADKLFNAHLEREGRARVLYYDGDNARKARIGTGTQLVGCTTEAIPRLFGSLIAQGNDLSPRRQEEKLGGLRDTQTVTMDLQKVGDGALVNLSLARREGSQIYEKLYPSRK